MKPGRSSVSASWRIETGTPPISRGSGLVRTVSPPSGRSEMLARTTTVPRSTGPTLPGIAIARPARPPSVGPVSETVPLSATGASPLPAVALTEPTRVFGRADAGVRGGVRADRHALEAAGEPGRQLGGDARDVL